jgi:hypothetical protein
MLLPANISALTSIRRAHRRTPTFAELNSIVGTLVYHIVHLPEETKRGDVERPASTSLCLRVGIVFASAGQCGGCVRVAIVVAGSIIGIDRKL